MIIPLHMGRTPRGARTLAAAILLGATPWSAWHPLLGQERPPADSTMVPGAPAVADSGGLGDSIVVYSPPGAWGSVDTQLPSAWTLTRTELSWQGGRSLGEAFRSFPGFTLLDPGSDGQYMQLFARGVDARSVGFLLNGRAVQDPLSGIANPYHLQWMELDRAEIVTGPRSFLYGLNTQGAAVNIVTRDFNAIKPYTRIAYSEGPDEYSYSDGAFVQNISRRLNVHAGFQHLGTDGAYPNAPHDQWNVRGKVRYHLSEGYALILSGQYLYTQTGLNGGIDPASTGTALAFLPLQAALVNTDAYEKLTRHDLDCTLAGRWDDSTALLRATLYTSGQLREYRDEENRTAPNSTFIQSDHRVRSSGVTARQEFRIAPFAFLIGGMAEAVRVQESPSLGMRNATRLALWARVEADITPALRASAFTRMEKSSGTSGAGAGGDLEWSITPGLNLFGGISQSARLPSLFENFWVDSTVTRARPAGFEPEQHTHAEVGFEVHPSPSLRMRTAFFHRIIESPIDILDDSLNAGFPGIVILQGGPGGSRTITGAEATLSAQFWHLLLEGSGTWLASLQGGEAPGERIPKLQARGGLYLRGVFFDGSLDIKAGVRGTYSSSFIGDRFNGATLSWGASSGATIAAWSQADFILTAGIGDARIDFLWENLTGVRGFAARYYALPERGIWFRIRWEFLN